MQQSPPNKQEEMLCKVKVDLNATAPFSVPGHVQVQVGTEVLATVVTTGSPVADILQTENYVHRHRDMHVYMYLHAYIYIYICYPPQLSTIFVP